MPGVIESYDSETGLARVRPSLKERSGSETQASSYPIITGVPVVFPRTKTVGIKLPLKRGDSGVILFSERSLERWIASGGGEVDPEDTRKFHLSDGMFIPGLYPKGQTLRGKGSSDDLELINGTTSIMVKPDGFEAVVKPPAGPETRLILDASGLKVIAGSSVMSLKV